MYHKNFHILYSDYNLKLEKGKHKFPVFSRVNSQVCACFSFSFSTGGVYRFALDAGGIKVDYKQFATNISVVVHRQLQTWLWRRRNHRTKTVRSVGMRMMLMRMRIMSRIGGSN
jgi:hypothetical protein